MPVILNTVLKSLLLLLIDAGFYPESSILYVSPPHSVPFMDLLPPGFFAKPGVGGLGSNLASYFYIYLLRGLMFFEWRAGPTGVVDKCIKHWSPAPPLSSLKRNGED